MVQKGFQVMIVFMYKLKICQLNYIAAGSNDNAICSMYIYRYMYMYIKVIWPPLKLKAQMFIYKQPLGSMQGT